MHIVRVMIAVMVSALAMFAVVSTASASSDVTPHNGVELVQH
jgi:hypothetical protein